MEEVTQTESIVDSNASTVNQETTDNSEITSIDQLRDKVETPTEAAVDAEKEVIRVPEKAVEPAAEEKKTDALIATDAAKDVPAFVPDFKFKAGGKEYEIPEKFRSLIKNEDDQKELKEFFEKSYGLDDLKPRHQKVKDENEFWKTKVLPEYQKQDGIINELAGYIKNKDYDSYFERLQIPEKDLQTWMYRKLSLTPEQQQLYNQSRELQKQTYQLQSEKQELTQKADAATREIQQVQEQKILEQLDFTLQKGEYKDAVQSFDAMNGQGAFQRKVTQYAAFVAQTENKNLSVEDAVKGFIQFTQPAKAIASITEIKAASKEKPVLPVTNARPLSPSGQQITSIKQLREKAQRAQTAE